MPIHGTIGAVSGSLEIGDSGAAVTTILDEDNMASNSATALATQQSIKAYVDATSAPTLGAIGNVNTTDTTKAAGHVLVWDNTQSRWENAAIAGTSNEVDITLGDGSVTVGLPNDVTVSGDLTVGGGDINGPTDADLYVRSNRGIILHLDEDETGTPGSHNFRIRNGANSQVLELSEAGNLDIAGDLTVSGGDISYTNSQDATISIAATAHNVAGKSLTIDAGTTTAGTTNDIAGGDITLRGGRGKGTGKGGDLIFQSAAPAESSANSLNAHQTLFSVSGQNGLVTTAGSLKIGGPSIQNSQGEATITMDNDQNVEVAGDLTVTGGSGTANLTIGADSDGQDRSVTFGHSTIKTIMGIADGQDRFAIHTNASFEGTNDIEIDGSGNVTIGNGTLTVSSGDLFVEGGAWVKDGSDRTTLTLGDGTADADIKVFFNSSTNDYYIGSDATDDSLHIGVGSTVGSSSAVTVTSGSFVEFPYGLKSPSSVKVNSNNTESDNYWVKIAEGTSPSQYDTMVASFLVMIAGSEWHSTYAPGHIFMITAKLTRGSDNSGNAVAQANGTKVYVDLLDSDNLLDGWDPASDVKLEFNNDGTSAIWVRSKERRKDCFVSYLGGSNSPSHGSFSDQSWEIVSGVSWQSSTEQGSASTHSGEYTNKKFSGLTLGSVEVTSILDEDAMGSNSATALATQQSIKAYVDSQVQPTLTTEQVQDIVGGMFSGNTETNITATYQDGDGTVDLVVAEQRTTEQVQDIVGAMFTGNTETNITATYQDGDGTIDLSSVNTTYSAGTGLDLSSTTFSVDVSDFLSNGANNRIVTATGADAMNAEANLTYDGTSLTVNNRVDIEGTTPTLQIGDGGNEDIKLLFNSNTNDYYIGSDATDDNLHIGVGSTIGTNSAMVISSGSFVEFPKGLRNSPSVFAGTTAYDSLSNNKWMKIAEHKDGLSGASHGTAIGTFLVHINGLGHTSYDVFMTWLITVQWGEMSNSVVTGPPSTKISAQLLDSSESDDFAMDPDHFVLTVNGVTEGAVWVQAPVNYCTVTATHLGGSPSRAGGDGPYSTTSGQVNGWVLCDSTGDMDTWQTAYTSLGTDFVADYASSHVNEMMVEGSLLVSGSTALSDTLRVNKNTGETSAHAVFHETATNDYARISFTNTADTSGHFGNSHEWTIAAKAAEEGSPGSALLNIWYGDADADGTGRNIIQVHGDNHVEMAKLHLTSDQDASQSSTTQPALTIGPSGGAHILIDPNEILAKSNGTTAATLYLNTDGGNVRVNQNGGGTFAAHGGNSGFGAQVFKNDGNTSSNGFAVEGYGDHESKTIRFFLDSNGVRSIYGSTNGDANIVVGANGLYLETKPYVNEGSAADFILRRFDSSLTDGEQLGRMIFQGRETSSANYAGVAAVEACADASWTGSSYPTKLQFWATPSSATSNQLAAVLRATDNSTCLQIDGNISQDAFFTDGHQYKADDSESSLIEKGDCLVLVNGKLKKSSSPKQKNVAGIAWYRVSDHKTDEEGGSGFSRVSNVMKKPELIEDIESEHHGKYQVPHSDGLIYDSIEDWEAAEDPYSKEYSKKWRDSLGASYDQAERGDDGEWVVNSEFAKVWKVMSLGDSRQLESHDPEIIYATDIQGFKVCNEGGAIEAGDLLCTSSTPGYLMKQDDDLMHSYTVAKSMQDVTFDSEGKSTGVYGYIYCG